MREWKRMVARALGLGSLLLLVPSTGCAGSIHGQVLDAQSGQPIAGAVVLGVWTKVAGLPGLTHTELVGVKEVETDAQGRFTLERPRTLFPFAEDDESITVYKFGYIAWNNIFTFPPTGSGRRKDQRVPAEIRLEKFPDGQSHQRHISFINLARGGLYGLDRIPRFWDALQPEMRMAREKR
jgi:hypothetical protein